MNSLGEISCKNCGNQLQGSFCHQCGQRVIHHRWTTSVLFQQFIHQLTNIEKGFLFTAKGMFLFPGKLLLDYWKGATIKYYNPFRYFLILIAINLLINFWLGIDEMLAASMEPEGLGAAFGEERLEVAGKRFNSWLNILVLFLIPIKSWVTKFFFKKHDQNYAEHLIMNSFIMGQQSLMTSFTHFIFYAFPVLFPGYLFFNFLLGWVYDSYVFKQAFGEPNWKTILKAFLNGAIGIIAFFILVAIFSTIALAVS